MIAPPVHLTDKVREMLRLLASDPVMAHALHYANTDHCPGPAVAMLRVSVMDNDEWQTFEEKFRARVPA